MLSCEYVTAIRSLPATTNIQVVSCLCHQGVKSSRFTCFQIISCHFAVRGHVSLSVETHASTYSSPLMTDAASTIAATCSVEHQYVFSKKSKSRNARFFCKRDTLCNLQNVTCTRACRHREERWSTYNVNSKGITGVDAPTTLKPMSPHDTHTHLMMRAVSANVFASGKHLDTC